MSVNRESIELVANGGPNDLQDVSTYTESQQPQMLFVHGLIALSRSKRDEALELFPKSLADGDARFVTHYARAFEKRLALDISEEK